MGSNIFKLCSVITMLEEWQNFEIVGFNNNAGRAPSFLVIFSYFFEYCVRQETQFSNLIKLLLKVFGKSPKTFPVDTSSKTSFLTSTKAVVT